MCSVRHSPMPSAPNSRARVASAAVSALARTARWPALIASAQPSTTSSSAGGSTAAVVTAPTITSPLDPSMEITSPSLTVTGPTAKPPGTKRICSAPHTAGVPHPLATTAAWLARPPRDVRMPAATDIPCTSSGVVSARTRITGRPAAACGHGGVGGEDDRPDGGARRGAEATGEHVVTGRLERRVQHLLDVLGADAPDRLGPRQRHLGVGDELDRDPERRRAGTAGEPRAAPTTGPTRR